MLSWVMGQIQGGGPVASDFPGGDLGKGPCGTECIAAAMILGDAAFGSCGKGMHTKTVEVADCS